MSTEQESLCQLPQEINTAIHPDKETTPVRRAAKQSSASPSATRLPFLSPFFPCFTSDSLQDWAYQDAPGCGWDESCICSAFMLMHGIELLHETLQNSLLCIWAFFQLVECETEDVSWEDEG